MVLLIVRLDELQTQQFNLQTVFLSISSVFAFCLSEILQSLRVTLKMEVSHTEHSHVIGKGGNNIQRVMQETDCHIHFPDSNRNNLGEKSNQVGLLIPCLVLLPSQISAVVKMSILLTIILYNGILSLTKRCFK